MSDGDADRGEPSPGPAGPAAGGSRRARWLGVVGLAVRRSLSSAGRGGSRQTALTVLGVAVAVATTLVVASVALALVSGPAVAGTDAAYWIVPGGSASSAVTAVEGQRLGQAHPTAERIEGFDGVERATPVLYTLTRIEAEEDAPYVLVVGVVAHEGTTVAGLPADPLTPGDPFYANGSYEGAWTGEAVLSTSAAQVLNVSEGDPIGLGGGRVAAAGGVRVTRVVEPTSSGVGQLPVALVHLAELQWVTGAAETDSADQILVRATPGADVRERLEGVYPNSEVLTQGGLIRQRAMDSRLPVAVSVAGLIVGVVVGALVVATALGFELLADAPERAVMAAVGISGRSRLLLVAAQGLTVTLAGGLAGIVLWLAGAGLANLVSTRLYGGGIVARLHPAIGAYGVGVALLVAMLAVPYLLVLGGRTNVLERLEDA
jgi:putative ABC transport system permease protein